MTSSVKKHEGAVVKPGSLKVKAARAAVAKRGSASSAKKAASTSQIKGYAPLPKKKPNRFTMDSASVLSFAIKAGIITPDKKLTPSYK